MNSVCARQASPGAIHLPHTTDGRLAGADGAALTVYHGSTVPGITRFDTHRVNGDEVGAFFSDSWAEAATYGSAIYAAHLRIRNPYVVTADAWGHGRGLSPIDARDRGHDGYAILDMECADGGCATTYIAFIPDQILLLPARSRAACGDSV